MARMWVERRVAVVFSASLDGGRAPWLRVYRQGLPPPPPRIDAGREAPASIADEWAEEFRPRDVAAGGQGAPLVPMADLLLFAAADHPRVLLNLGGMANCLGALLPRMKARRAGMIVGIASVAGYRGLPGAEAYGATKAAQINLLESLRARLRPDGIDVLTVCPGFVETEMTEANTFPMPFMIKAPQAAQAIADGMEKQSARIVFPWQMALLMKAARLVPDRLWARALTPRS